MIGSALLRLFRRRRTLAEPPSPASESDVARDEGLANSRMHGGGSTDTDDAATTTGTGRNDLFVGRAAGQDLGYEGATGAEARAADIRDDPHCR